MLLLGVRAAARRGVTINSHGGGWREGEPLRRPFNLSDMSLASHTAIGDAFVGEDPRIERILERVKVGFDQVTRQPRYQDLPVYDALRRLGAREDAWRSIPIEEEILVLCSYDREYFDTWNSLRRRVKEALSEQGILSAVVRLLDVATPQLVSQALYERVRRCAGCIADWTRSSPSTFFELGVRLAVSPWSVVQIVDQDWLAIEGQREAPREQLTLMRSLLSPLAYSDIENGDLADRVASQLVDLRSMMTGSTGHRIRQVVAAGIALTERVLPSVYEDLSNEADALDHHTRVRDNVPQTLFYEVTDLKEDQEKAARERRLAAWLYLEHRVSAGDLDDGDQRKSLWRLLGELVASDLFLSEAEADQDLALEISERLA